PRARQGARRAEPRDHGLEREADVRLQSRLKRAGAAWRQELAPRTGAKKKQTAAASYELSNAIRANQHPAQARGGKNRPGIPV
ncbi:MAG: hypothetical protein WBE62_17785, partial [Methylocella sp.]